MKKHIVILATMLTILSALFVSCTLDPVDGQAFTYVTFKSDASFCITPSYSAGKAVWDGTLQYSNSNPADPESWEVFKPKKVTTANADLISGEYVIYIRGVDNTLVSAYGNGWTIQATDDVHCTGDIMSLLNCLDTSSATMGTDCFASMFQGWDKLVDVPLLSATTLSSGCYRSMFEDCTSLLVEEIPSGSYPTKWWGEWIFQVPTNAPADATTDMFSDCASNSVTVNSSVTAGSVYRSFSAEEPEMNFLTFSSDSPFSLKVPNREWGRIQSSTNLFSPDHGWTERTERTEQNYIQAGFDGEKYVIYVRGKGHGELNYGLSFKSSGTGLIDCTGNIMSLVDFEDMAGAEVTEACFNFLFDGMTSLRTAPELPAMELAPYCYYYMFENCTSLTEVPVLPATQLADSCYSCMFAGCSSLVDAPVLSSMNLAPNCYRGMFSDCTSLVASPSLPALTLAESCYCCMFDRCTSLAEVPVLSATVLASGCYCAMFQDCSNLKIEEVVHGGTPTQQNANFIFYASNGSMSTYAMFMFLRNNEDCIMQDQYGDPMMGCDYYWF